MSGNGRGNMRPTSKSPPFLVVGLLVAMCILAFNYWNLSSKNGELSQQFTRLQVDFRTVSDKHLTVEKRAGDLAAQLAELQARLNQLQHSVSEKDNRVTDLTGEVESYKSQLQKAQQTLQAAQGEVQRLQQEKNSVNGELEHLKEHLKETQDKHVSCDKSACREPIREVVGVLASAVDKTAIQTALNVHHPEVLSMVQDLVQGGNQVQGQQQPQNPVGGVPGENQQKADETGKLQQPQQPAQMVGQDPNVVQMQQGAAFPQQGGGDGVFPGQPQQQHEVVEQQKPQPVDTQDVLGVLKAKDSNVPEQKIVAQNIPQPGGDDANPVDPNNVNDLNVPAAQEDVADDRHMDLPEDEMDKQAAANHGAGGLENLDDNLHNQLQDLSKNDLAGEGHDEGDPLDDEEEKGEAAMDLNARDRLEERRAEEGDYDEAEQRQMEGVHEANKVNEETAKEGEEKQSEKIGQTVGEGEKSQKGSKRQGSDVTKGAVHEDKAANAVARMEIDGHTELHQVNTSFTQPFKLEPQQQGGTIEHEPPTSEQLVTESNVDSPSMTTDTKVGVRELDQKTFTTTTEWSPLLTTDKEEEEDKVNKELEPWMETGGDIPEEDLEKDLLT